MIHEEICTYEVSKLAKEKGFDAPTHYAYNENCQKAMYMELCLNRNTKDSRSISAPTQSLLQRWLREEKDVIIELKYSDITEDWRPFWSWIIYNNLGFILEIGDNSSTYELALEDAELYCLKNLL